MKVLLFHPVTLPPKDYGGVERVVLWLAQGLLERGHQVSVAALEGSQLPKGVELVPISSEQRSAAEFVKHAPRGLDVIHFMAPPEKDAWENLPCAGLVTVHGNGKPGERFHRNTLFLSADHARRHEAKAFVWNGLNPDEYLFEPKLPKRDWLFLSKTSWKVKNVAGAIRLCSRARAPLAIAGGSRPWIQRARVALSPRMSWVGSVGGAKKAELLSRSKGLVFPVLWPEPFGLVVIEALVSGAPVLAHRMGSLPELVPSHVGALMESEEDPSWMENLSADTPKWSPEVCRDWVLSNFTHLKMAEAYEGYYKQVIAGKLVQDSEPQTTRSLS